jgi:hypothetical protein
MKKQTLVQLARRKPAQNKTFSVRNYTMRVLGDEASNQMILKR